MTILVPFDGSDQSEYALDVAVESFEDDKILLLHVVEPFADHTEAGGYTSQRYEQEIDAAEEMLSDVVESIPEGKTVESEIRYGRPAQEIVNVADELAVDAIVIGSHGRDGAKRLLLGSIAESVIRRANVPVTVVREPEAASGGKPDRVVVAFDGSDESKRALTYAIEQYPEAEIIAVYAVYPPLEVRDSDPDELPAELENWSKHVDDHTEGVLDLAVDHADERGVSITIGRAVGEPAEGIVEYADENEVDLIVMGSHGRDGLKRLVMGSVAETVARRAPTSVTVVD
ncbi:MAG: nucleotide-binding universal stress UspA family protein [Natronomonas sp.]|jgi:nucleotide-binding universal stress UspA family protein